MLAELKRSRQKGTEDGQNLCIYHLKQFYQCRVSVTCQIITKFGTSVPYVSEGVLKGCVIPAAHSYTQLFKTLSECKVQRHVKFLDKLSEMFSNGRLAGGGKCWQD